VQFSNQLRHAVDLSHDLGMVVPASLTRAHRGHLGQLSVISALISRAACALRWARLRTSLATTAKPRPCSPARAASTAALSARMLV